MDKFTMFSQENYVVSKINSAAGAMMFGISCASLSYSLSEVQVQKLVFFVLYQVNSLMTRQIPGTNIRWYMYIASF